MSESSLALVEPLFQEAFPRHHLTPFPLVTGLGVALLLLSVLSLTDPDTRARRRNVLVGQLQTCLNILPYPNLQSMSGTRCGDAQHTVVPELLAWSAIDSAKEQSNMVKRPFKAWHLHRADLDTTTFLKAPAFSSCTGRNGCSTAPNLASPRSLSLTSHQWAGSECCHVSKRASKRIVLEASGLPLAAATTAVFARLVRSTCTTYAHTGVRGSARSALPTEGSHNYGVFQKSIDASYGVLMPRLRCRMGRTKAAMEGAGDAAVAVAAGETPNNRPQSFLVLCNLRDQHNFCRLSLSAQTFGVTGVYTVGLNSRTGSNLRAASVAFVQAHANVSQHHFDTLTAAKADLAARGVRLCGVEIVSDAKPVHVHPFEGSTAFMFGNEGQGMSRKQREACDFFAYVPQHSNGTAKGEASLNVAVAGSIILHHFAIWSGMMEQHCLAKQHLAEQPFRQLLHVGNTTGATRTESATEGAGEVMPAAGSGDKLRKQPQSLLVIPNDNTRRTCWGALLRSACALGVAEVYIVGPRKVKNRIGNMGTERRLLKRHFYTLADAKADLAARGVRLCGVEFVDNAEPVQSHPFDGSTAFMLGDEGRGLTAQQREACDFFVYIPQQSGKIRASQNAETPPISHAVGPISFSGGAPIFVGPLNVAEAGGIVFHHFAVWSGSQEQRRSGQKFVVACQVWPDRADKWLERGDRPSSKELRGSHSS